MSSEEWVRIGTGERFERWLELEQQRWSISPDSVRRAVELAEALGPPDEGRTLGEMPWEKQGFRKIALGWVGHDCRLRVALAGTQSVAGFVGQGKGGAFESDDPSVEEIGGYWSYIQDSVAAGSLGLTVEEWRALTEQEQGS